MTNLLRNYELFGADQALNGFDELFHAILSGLGTHESKMGNLRNLNEPVLTCSVEDSKVVAVLPIPGCRTENMDIAVSGNILNVRVKRGREKIEKEDVRFLRRERSCSDFETSVRLPVKVKGNEATAKYVNGVLTVEIPKDEMKNSVHVVPVH